MHFSYDGESSMDHDIIICSFGDGESVSGGQVEMSTVKSPNTGKWYKTNATYNEPLSFTFSICKNPCTISNQDNLVISPIDQVDLKRWLARKDYRWLHFQDDEMNDVFYNARLEMEEQRHLGIIIGYKITATCDAPWGWSDERIAKLNNHITEVFDNSDEIGEIVPQTTITVQNDGQILIYNDNTMEETRIDNCKSGEIITLTEMFSCKSKNSDHNTLHDDFNWVFPKIQNSYIDNRNSFELTNCTIELKWREPRKAVI